MGMNPAADHVPTMELEEAINIADIALRGVQFSKGFDVKNNYTILL